MLAYIPYMDPMGLFDTCFFLGKQKCQPANQPQRYLSIIAGDIAKPVGSRTVFLLMITFITEITAG